MEMTLAEANKELKKLQVKYEQLLLEEKENSTFLVSIQEDVESNRPEFDFNKYLKQLDGLVFDIKKLKHKINIYNSQAELYDLHITIDEALLLLPILNQEKDRLYILSNMPKKKRVQDNRYSSNVIDYQYVNYDVKEAKDRYNAVVEKINSIQFSLDKINNTLLFEF